MPESFAVREGSPDHTPVSLEKRLHGKFSGTGNGAWRISQRDRQMRIGDLVLSADERTGEL